MTTEYLCGPIFFRENRGRIIGHRHNFDHATLIVRGSWRVRKWVPQVDESGEQVRLPAIVENGKIVVPERGAWVMVADKVFHPGQRVLVEAGAKHDMEPIDGTPNPLALCIYPLREPSGDIVLYETGFDPAFQMKPDGPHGFDPHPAELERRGTANLLRKAG